nr:hydrogenase maturation factor [Lachnospiraceae bacterium]
MKPGKISENVLKRSVLKYINQDKKEIARGAAMGNDCALFSLCDCASTAVCSLSVKEKEALKHAVFGAVNNLAAGGKKASYLIFNITLPEKAREIRLQEIMEEAARICEEEQIQIIGGHTEISSHVEHAVISVTALGKVQEDKCENAPERVPGSGDLIGCDVVVSGYIGADGASLLAVQKEEELAERFPLWLVNEAKNFRKELSVVPAAKIAMSQGVQVMHDIREGGIFGALWEMAQRESVGLTVQLKQIPMKQSVVEICNYYDLNPYELLSEGCLLMVAKDGETLADALCENGVEAAVIGTVTGSNDRIIENGEEIRYMDLPKPDQIRKLL